MAKRALGALPTVQPLSSPHFAAPVSVAQQRESISPEQNSEAVRDDEESGASQRHKSLPQPERAETRHVQARSQSGSEANAGNRPSLNREPAREPEHGGEKIVQTNEYTIRSPRIEPGDAEVETGAPLPAQLEKEAPAHRTLEISAGDKEEEDRPITAALELHRPAARPLSARQRDAAAPVEQRTEIQISIGSIELRAPRVEARPQSQPFRPRVTLNEFLSRKPEAGA
jgi:hypothetical protein